MTDELEITRTFQYNVDPQFVYHLTSDLELAHDIRLGLIGNKLCQIFDRTSMTNKQKPRAEQNKSRKIYGLCFYILGQANGSTWLKEK
jgi:hypothetical protein